MSHSIDDITDVASLRTAIAGGFVPDYLMFWGHRSNSPAMGKHVLSQWWPVRFKVDDVVYPTAEHFMMAQKARLFGDTVALKQILMTTDPGAAKDYGRKVRNFDDKVWVENCRNIVVRGNMEKFGQNPDLKNWLLRTGDAVLVEASPYDRIWGIGLKAEDPRSQDPSKWQGNNFLGFDLMEVRRALRS